jgi:hypothetical protein
MKNATVAVSFDAEKMGAIKQYMGKKDSELQSELDDFMEKLYEKYVPAPVREYIESKQAEPEEKPKRPSRAATSQESGTAADQE